MNVNQNNLNIEATLEDTWFLNVEDWYQRRLENLVRSHFAQLHLPLAKTIDPVAAALQLNFKIPEPHVRAVYRAKDFECPAEVKDGLEEFIAANQIGSSLLRFLSKTSICSDRFDGLLFDWAIHHFHLGVGVDPRDKRFAKRTGPILFAAVTPDSIHFIRIGSHNGEWSDKNLVGVIADNWPQMLAPYKLPFEVTLVLRDDTPVEQTNDVIEDCRAARVGSPVINVPGHGSYFAPGLGYTGWCEPSGNRPAKLGVSLLAQFQSQTVQRWLTQCVEELFKACALVRHPSLSDGRADDGRHLRFDLKWEGRQLFVWDKVQQKPWCAHPFINRSRERWM